VKPSTLYEKADCCGEAYRPPAWGDSIRESSSLCADQLPPRTPGSERRAEPVQPEVVSVELRALRHRLQAIEEIQLGIASPGREHEAASLVRLRLPEGPEIYAAVNSVSRHRRKSARRRTALAFALLLLPCAARATVADRRAFQILRSGMTAVVVKVLHLNCESVALLVPGTCQEMRVFPHGSFVCGSIY
jgi:hypothetical protein